MNLALKSQGINIPIHCWHFPAFREKSSLMALQGLGREPGL